jgi:hypothetical protein
MSSRKKNVERRRVVERAENNEKITRQCLVIGCDYPPASKRESQKKMIRVILWEKREIVALDCLTIGDDLSVNELRLCELFVRWVYRKKSEFRSWKITSNQSQLGMIDEQEAQKADLRWLSHSEAHKTCCATKPTADRFLSALRLRHSSQLRREEKAFYDQFFLGKWITSLCEHVD